jgi:hypothetical protein
MRFAPLIRSLADVVLNGHISVLLMPVLLCLRIFSRWIDPPDYAIGKPHRKPPAPAWPARTILPALIQRRNPFSIIFFLIFFVQ